MSRTPKPFGHRRRWARSRGELFELRNLVVGKVAPEIEGQDLDGRTLRLSDFRGKVVALAFWATWCGPCMYNVPKELELQAAASRRSCSSCSASMRMTNRDSTARSRAAKEHITWQSWWDGQNGPDRAMECGELADVHVLDQQGSFRYKNPQGDHFYKAIDRVVAEAETGAK